MRRPRHRAAFHHRQRQCAAGRGAEVTGDRPRHAQGQVPGLAADRLALALDAGEPAGAGHRDRAAVGVEQPPDAAVDRQRSGGVVRRPRHRAAFHHRQREVARAQRADVAVHRPGDGQRQVAVVQRLDVAYDHAGHRHAQVARGRLVVVGQLGGRGDAARDRQARIRADPAALPDRHHAALLQQDGRVHVPLAADRLHRPVHEHAVRDAFRARRRARALAQRDGVDDGLEGVVLIVSVRVDSPPAIGVGGPDVSVSVRTHLFPGNGVRARVQLRADGPPSATRIVQASSGLPVSARMAVAPRVWTLPAVMSMRWLSISSVAGSS